MADILVIEDNLELSAVIRDFLEAEGYSVASASSAEEGLELMDSQAVKLLLLDIMLPGIDGFAVCRLAREKYNLPILIMSARHGDDNKIIGLELGADDYLEKPFTIQLLIAKVKAHMRRSYEMNDNRQLLTDGDLLVNRSSMQVFLAEAPVSMTMKEYELLVLLLNNRGKALRKEWLFEQVWGADSFSEPSTLTVHINKLREKIELNPKQPQRIVTVWGVGYKYEAV
ncbi:DNA-binding response OmpR family regulator [Paenibacillus sp. PastF-1]|uniref:response regulator transcription factor n=1 Tax=unclassified Paenibacillus TaxID=185978 RepID=UPI002473511A|nr:MULTISPECIES: response regulator transcription factor [unclassified Paenibacillus]MDF9839221.1 DNA-binding response OmpR family regulator [Paenibacillus sp. PastF-2]MDF9845802.1 DNA-binding response OmpR family regulator [Paenibacillus sp. PastM-2]MDF9852375.1 DNA-binding response OmpR family regulator [Paenibacillus sp. PastF-1]MDH6477895.1 DNA-binding response OmpR family regulator [Paenibacillus sp. PastH-2]MDH6505634.1 DNA-binding response OmpR family regulator [Paenibacillus sp. PastM-